MEVVTAFCQTKANKYSFSHAYYEEYNADEFDSMQEREINCTYRLISSVSLDTLFIQ